MQEKTSDAAAGERCVCRWRSYPARSARERCCEGCGSGCVGAIGTSVHDRGSSSTSNSAIFTTTTRRMRRLDEMHVVQALHHTVLPHLRRPHLRLVQHGVERRRVLPKRLPHRALLVGRNRRSKAQLVGRQRLSVRPGRNGSGCVGAIGTSVCDREAKGRKL